MIGLTSFGRLHHGSGWRSAPARHSAVSGRGAWTAVLSPIAAAFSLRGALGIALLRVVAIQPACGFDFRGSLRFSWLAPGPPIRLVFGCFLGMGLVLATDQSMPFFNNPALLLVGLGSAMALPRTGLLLLERLRGV